MQSMNYILWRKIMLGIKRMPVEDGGIPHKLLKKCDLLNAHSAVANVLMILVNDQ